jgi:DNA-binding transcriptional LysR family regulator
MIEMYLLEQLNAFYKYGTLSIAAEHLHLSQPSLSRSMQKLEEELGVILFERQKNRIFLNDTGKLAAEYAARILVSEAEMERQVRTFDRNLRTLTVGSCAPGPLIKVLPRITGSFTELTVSSKIETEENLLKGLRESDYQLVILSKPIDSNEFYYQEYVTERLYLSINNFHPAATFHSVSFDQMDGQNFIMYAHVGVWEEIVRTKMPHAKFYKQEDIEAVGELANNSDLPSFSTNITLEELSSRQNNRINIPFSDEEATITFYIACTKENKKRYQRFLNSVEVI